MPCFIILFSLVTVVEDPLPNVIPMCPAPPPSPEHTGTHQQSQQEDVVIFWLFALNSQ